MSFYIISQYHINYKLISIHIYYAYQIKTNDKYNIIL